MVGDYDDVNSPEFQNSIRRAEEAAKKRAETQQPAEQAKGDNSAEYGMWTSLSARDALLKLAKQKGIASLTAKEKATITSSLTRLSMEDKAKYQAVIDAANQGWGPKGMKDVAQEAEKRIKKYDSLRAMSYPERKAELARLKAEDPKLFDAMREMATFSKSSSDKVAFSETTFKEAEKEAAQRKPAARSSVELTDLSSDALYDLYKKNLIIINGKTFEDIKKDLKNFDKLAQEAVDTIKNHPEKCKEVRPIKLDDLSKTELARLAQNGKVKVIVYVVDGVRKWSYHALTPEEKAKGDKYWIEHNKKQRPELFGLTREQVNAGNDNKPAESRSAGGNSGNAGSAESRGNLTISDNMKYALNMGPTVLKEELEAMGYKFDASMIRHGANGDYIPTSKLRAWMQNQEFTAEQISRLNALVDDRAAFNAKVKEINDRDSYVAAAPARDAAAAATGAAAAPAEEVAEQSAEKSGADKLKDDLATLAATNGAAYNGMMAAFQALRSNDDSQIPDQMMQILINMMKQYGYTDMCQMANDGLDAMKVDDKTRAGNDGVDMAATATAKTRPDATKPKDPQHVADLEAARKLLKEDPKKFKTAKEAYSKAAASGDKRAAELLAAMNEVDKDSKEALKKQASKDKENADQAQQEVKEEGQKKSLKKALQNRAHDVSNFFKKTFGIKTKKDKEKEAAQAAEQQKAQQQADALANRKITLEHDKDGNAVYTLSGYGRFDGGDHNGLYDGKYTVYQSENASAVKFAANDGAQFTDFVQGGQQLPVVQALKDEMTARSAEQAQVAARMAQQKTNS